MARKIRVFLLMFALTLALVGCGESETATETTQKEEKQETTETVVYEDAVLTATFKGVSDVAGQIGMSFTLVNNGSEEITVLPLDSSVNDVMVLFTSGIPATIQPGKKANVVWLANPEIVGISGSDEVTSIELSLHFGDTETDIIKIEP